MVPEFSRAVFNAPEFGVIPEVVETQFGFHIIVYEDSKASTSETSAETRVKFAKAFFSTTPDGWQATGLTGQHFRRADVGSDPTTMRPIVNIYFTQVAIAEEATNWWILVWYLVALSSTIALFSSLVGIFMSEGRIESLRRDKILALASVVILAASIYGIMQSETDDAPEVAQPEIEASNGEVSETDSAGVDLFAEITKRNLHKPIAIFLDGFSIIDTNGDGVINEFDPAYAPVVQSEIINGQAVISGLKSYEEANELVQNLNTGAIPAPVKLSGQFTVGATLGEEALTTSLEAGILGLFAVAIFMMLFYRLPGIIASLALTIYGILLVFAFQVFGVVLTLAGVAGVILSIGMAVDANILIFERMKEELKLGKSLARSVEDGFDRAWTSIRDSNVSSLITCAILFWFGSSIIQGFALTLAVGILLSMFSAITVSRNFLRIAVSFIKNELFYGFKK
ncbi:protein translocase subunit SecD [Candidatus Gracilibacteria bacterium]|nr:protein translocase subunit SecD [Candidatus Gracilibacteria bacterium]MCF7856713.1 protein translocase subunit SecD [Candidatus Gracilibacteria bacterium]MCF7897019.1 protein translocase subunit SecD [Candidatus Gracilibacteria bacterium]